MIRLRVRYPFEPWTCSCCGARVEGAPPHSFLAGLACEACLDRGRRGDPFIPLTVRAVPPPRRPEERPIYAACVRRGRVLTEAGEVFDLDQLPDRIRERRPGELGSAGRGQVRRRLPDRLAAGLVFCDHGLDLLAYLDNSAAAESPMWQWQASLRERSAFRPEAGLACAAAMDVKPVRFGYASRKDDRRRGKGRAVWWQILDVHEFCDLPGGWGQPDECELLRFGLALRAWANRERLPVLTSASAYGARLLKDARFGGGWRRKVPAATNRRLRAKLPGNHYQLLTAAERTLPAVHKFDQKAAHHNAALHIQFPHPDTLWASGYFRAPITEGAPVKQHGPIRAHTAQWSELLARPGMFAVAVHVSERASLDDLAVPALRRPGTRWRTLTSVEVAHVRALQAAGVRVGLGDLWAAWTSESVDERLNELAWWALDRLDAASPADRRWVKPALLAAYGMLAARPRRFRQMWRWCGGPSGGLGVQTRYGHLVGLERSTKREREPATANVLARALIESYVRLESLTFAQRVRQDGMRPVSVYADAVFATGRLPDLSGLLRPPWRYEGAVHDLTFESAARYRAREETRLPGTPRRGRERALRPVLPARSTTTTGGHNGNRKQKAGQAAG